MIFDETTIGKYLKGNPKQSNEYQIATKQAAKIAVHAKGLKPKDLLEERRPHETEEAKAYRLKIFEPITKGPFGKIVNVLKRIPKAEGYSTIWKDMPKLVKSDETLKHYCEETYPGFVALEEWLWKYVISTMAVDANALICIWPINTDKTDNTEYYKPFANIFESAKVMEFVNDQHAIIKDKNGYLFIDIQNIYRYKKNNTGYIQESVFNHALGVLPVKQMGGFIESAEDGNVLYESFIAGILPHFNEAVREYSDIQAEVVQHIHSERWSWAGQECSTCKGAGELMKSGQKITCNDCKGTGHRPKSPFSEIIVKPSKENMGEQPVSIPPAGYIQKNVEIIKIQDERIKNHINDGFSAINFEFISNIPANQSGVAKDYDRQELEGFLYSIASQMVDIKNWCVRIFALYRYKIIISKEDMFASLPVIKVPNKFDVVTMDYKLQGIKAAKDANIGTSIVRSLTIDFVSKQFKDDPDERTFNELCIELDPLFGYSTDDKSVLTNTKQVSNTDAVISANISAFIDKALDTVNDFASMTTDAQMTILKQYAADKIKENSIATSIATSIDGLQSPEAAKLEAEGQANLRSTVGGAQALLEIQASVASGTSTIEAASAIIQKLYGFDEATALRMIGKPELVAPNSASPAIV